MATIKNNGGSRSALQKARVHQQNEPANKRNMRGSDEASCPRDDKGRTGASLDDKFFEMVLRRGLSDETINDVTIKSRLPAVGKGENFLSDMWRLVLGYRSRRRESGSSLADDRSGDAPWIASGTSEDAREIGLIVKCQPAQRGACSEMIEAQDFFQTEMKIYRNILPEIEKLVGRSLAPRCLFESGGETEYCRIVLEDLRVLGFKTKDRQTGMSLAHVRMVLEAIADFHAASVRLHEQNPDMMKSFNEGIISTNTPKNMFRVIEQTLGMVSERCRHWADPRYEKIGEKLDALRDKFAEEIVRAVSFDATEFCVLNHGDCWTNNIMFCEDERGQPLRVRLVDFQMSVYSSPVIDLLYCLSVCPAIDIKTDCDDILIDEYLRRLAKRMRLLGCKTEPPTIEDLERAVLKRRMWAVMAAIAFYPRMLADASEIESFDELVATGTTKMNIFKNPSAAVALKKSLLFMDERGYLD